MNRRTFLLRPVPPFRLDLTVWTLRRRPDNMIDRWDGATYRRVLALPDGPVEIAVTQAGPPDVAQLRVVVIGRSLLAGAKAAVSAKLERLLGLSIDLADFYQFAARSRRLLKLAERFRGMKPPRFPTVFECVINAMACQQVTLTLGIRLLGRLAATWGVAIAEARTSPHAFPRPEDLARLSPEDLRALGFSHQKGRAMIELARQIIEGRVDLEALADRPDEEVIAGLEDLRGVGRWTAEYVLLRGLGRLQVFPGDDIGARNNLQRWLHRAEPLDYAGVRRTLARWRPYAGLIYFHLLLDRLAEARHLPAERVPPQTARGRRSEAGDGEF